jgi:hypothetical protein
VGSINCAGIGSIALKTGVLFGFAVKSRVPRQVKSSHSRRV